MSVATVCQKAKDRIDKLEEQEQYLGLCKKYHICPNCGGDLVFNANGRSLRLEVSYICSECMAEFNLGQVI